MIIGCTCLEFGTTSLSSLVSRTIAIIFEKVQLTISNMSTTLKHNTSSLARSGTSGNHLVVVGRKNFDGFVKIFGVNEKMHDSIHNLFVSLVMSECIALILILTALVNNSF